MWGWRRCSMASGVRRALGGRLRPIGPGRHRWRPVLARDRGRATADAEARPCSRLLSPAALAGARGMAAGVVVAAWSFGPDREVAYAACGCSIGRAGLRAACKCARAQWPPSTPAKGGRHVALTDPRPGCRRPAPRAERHSVAAAGLRVPASAAPAERPPLIRPGSEGKHTSSSTGYASPAPAPARPPD